MARRENITFQERIVIVSTATASPPPLPSESIGLENSQDIFQKAVLLVLSFQYGFGLKKKVSKDFIQTEAEEGWVEGYKKTLKSPEFEAIKSSDQQLVAYIRTRCLPSLNTLFKSGIYPLPLELLSAVDEAIELHKVKRKDLVNKFLETYENCCEEAKSNLGSLWSQRDYPTIDELKKSLLITTRYVTINTPDSLKGISQSIFQREKEKTEAMWAEAREEMVQGLRVQLSEMLDYMVDKLGEGKTETGRKKALHTSMLDKYKDFLSTFDAKNIADDKELGKIVQQLKDCSEGLDPDDLRKNEDFRSKMSEKFAEAKDALSSMIVDKPMRHFAVQEE
jgi:hypothetical protein